MTLCMTLYMTSRNHLFWQSIHSPIFSMHTQPDNILIQVCRDGDTLKLLDVGAARLVGKGPPLHSYETTSNYEYTAPEVFQQDARVPATDIWSVTKIYTTLP